LEELESRTLLASTLQLVSTLQGGSSAVAAGNGSSNVAGVSADGRFVAFVSGASNLFPGEVKDPAADTNVFLLDRVAGATTLVSHAAGFANHTLATSSYSAVVSGDGSTVAFDSNDSNNSAPDGPLAFVWNSATKTVDKLPEMLVGNNFGPALRFPHTISHDGRYILLVNGGFADYVYDRISHTQTSFAVAAGDPSISDDGNYVAFIVGGSVGIYNRLTRVITPVARGCTEVEISNDGSVVAFASTATNLVPGQGGPAGQNVFVYNVRTGTTTLVSHASSSATTTANGDSSGVVLSGGGGFVAFQSNAPDLVAGQTGTAADNLFLYNVASGAVSLVSGVNGSGTNAAGSVHPSSVDISDDGRFLVYDTQSTPLVPGQTGPAATSQVLEYDRTTGKNALLSGSGGSATAGGNFDSTRPLVSHQAGFAVFDSRATDLSPAGTITNGGTNVWGSDLTGHAALLLSRAVAPGGDSVVTSTSGDGRFAVFTSNATNVVPGQVDTNFGPDLFLFDKQARVNTLVSHVPGLPTVAGNGVLSSGRPALSVDDNFVVFASTATNLVPGQASPRGESNVFVYNRQTGVVTLVSHVPGSPAAAGNGGSDFPAVSADGRYVAYFSSATNLLPTHGSISGSNLYLYDTVAGTTTLASHLSGDSTSGQGNQGGRDILADRKTIYDPPVMSDDGRYIAYTFTSPLVAGQTGRGLYVYDRTTNANSFVASDISFDPFGGTHTPVISADGNYVAFWSTTGNLVPGQSTAGKNVFLYSRATGSLTLVSGSGGSPTKGGNGDSDSPAINYDGSYVAFRSVATDLAAGQGGPAGSNVFEYSRLTGKSTLVSYAAGAPLTAASGDSSGPVIDADGSLVAYQSKGTDLVPFQNGPADVSNLFLWDRTTGNNVLTSGQDGSYTVGGDSTSFGPVLSRHSFPYFSSNATNLVTGAQGTTNAFVNTIVSAQVTLAPVTVPYGAGRGYPVGTFTVTVTQGPPGQLRLPDISFDPSGGDDGAFTITPVTTSAPGRLVLQVAVNNASKGTYSIVVDVDLGFGDALVNPFTLTVTGEPPPAQTSTTLTASPQTALVGQQVLFTATVSSATGGMVNFYLNGATLLGSVPLAGGLAALAAAVPVAGIDAITADYTGAPGSPGVAGFQPSSASLEEVVNPIGSVPTAVTLTASASPAPAGRPVTFTATVSSPAGAPPGSVDFLLDGATPLGSAPLSGGVAALAAAVPAGRHTVTAVYAPTGLYAGGTAAVAQYVAEPSGGPGVYEVGTGRWLLRDQDSGGGADFDFSYGGPGLIPVVGDWAGSGHMGVGVYEVATGHWLLKNDPGGGAPDFDFYYGGPGLMPVAGDWTGAGHAGVGLYEIGTGRWLLREALSGGAPDFDFSYGGPGLMPVAGDWAGAGHAGVGVYEIGTGRWLLRESDSAGGPDFDISYGGPGLMPVAGDFTGAGHAGVGVYEIGTGRWLLRESDSGGGPDFDFSYGGPGLEPVIGDYGDAELAPGAGPGAAALGDAQLQAAVAEALGRLAAAGAGPGLLGRLASARYGLAELPAGTLGLAYPAAGEVLVSADGAGYGWYAGPDSAFAPAGPGAPLVAPPGSPAAGREDLLTVVLHEMGHLAGRPDDGAGAGGADLMAEALPPGVRRTDALDAAFAQAAV
jgi:hypothetical protein